jgi:hypothetical protein
VNGREKAEQEWYEARTAWVAEQVEGGVWKCPACEAVLRLSKQEEADKVNVRCTGVLGKEHFTNSGGTNHWPTQMERVGDLVWSLDE